MTISIEKLSDDEFSKERLQVLNSWVTGSEIDFSEAVEIHKNLDEGKRAPGLLREADEEHKTLVQPRGGTGLLEDHISLLRFLQEIGEADLLPTTIDSYTRQNQYKLAQEVLERSKVEGQSLLNGFPLINYGVPAGRKIIQSVSIPIEVRHGSPDARLLAEIGLASGFTSFEGGGITYNIPYAKNVSIAHSIRSWQYVDRLVGLYGEKDVIIDRESYGALTGTLVAPAIAIAISIIELLLAVEQGVKCFTLGYGQGGNILQDVAALHALRQLGEEYSPTSTSLHTTFHQWMGVFPRNEHHATALIAYGAFVAGLARCTKLITKSQKEAHHIPNAEANAAGVSISKRIIRFVQQQNFLINQEDLQREEATIINQVRAIIERVLQFGNGDVALGTVRAFEAGILDVPFSPSQYVKGKLVCIKDF